MRIFHIFREYSEARSATLRRLLYGYGAALVLVAVLTASIVAAWPLWVFWTVVATEAVVDTILVRRWVIRDAAARAASHQSEPRPGSVGANRSDTA